MRPHIYSGLGGGQEQDTEEVKTEKYPDRWRGGGEGGGGGGGGGRWRGEIRGQRTEKGLRTRGKGSSAGRPWGETKDVR